MSDLAVSNNGEQKTASEFHDDYILHGTEHESFNCPFCMVGLVPKAIYTNGPQGKSPHFSHFPKKPHLNGCDGYPLVDGKSAKGAKKENTIKIGKEEFSFPEKLVSRTNPSQSKFVDDLAEIMRKDTPEKVKSRREKAGNTIGSAKYTSVIIRSFASSKKAIVSLVYKYAKEEKLSNEDRKLLLKEVLSQAPIELDGYKTNYQTAFQWTKYFSKYRKIWNGKGSVLVNSNRIYIKSEQATEYHNDEGIHELEFYVILEIPKDINTSPGYHRNIIDRLLKARSNGSNVNWFAYGLAVIELAKNAVLLEIDNLDHVFIEKI